MLWPYEAGPRCLAVADPVAMTAVIAARRIAVFMCVPLFDSLLLN
jgi:hypothetical protein